MSDGVIIKVEGLKDLEKRMMTLRDEVAGRALQSALGSAAKVVVDEVKKNVPESAVSEYKLYSGNHVSRGWLRNQVIGKRVKESDSSAQNVITFKDKKNSFFWRFLEFGTSKMKAKPFMRRSFEDSKQAALDRFMERLKQNIDKAKK